MRTLIELSTNHPIGTHFLYCIWVVRNWSDLTITERNQKIYDLNVKRNKLEAELAWVKQEIWIVNDQYDRQNLNLFEEMFGTDVTYTDTPMAEAYGGWQSD